MNIELKNIKIAEHLSEETTAFTADIFVNGKKVGYARNDGRIVTGKQIGRAHF